MEEHDQDLEKKYDEDLNTTLIFVSAAAERLEKRSNPEVAVGRHTGWFILSSNVCVHHRHPIRTQSRLRANE